jgi:hypothetical protein
MKFATLRDCEAKRRQLYTEWMVMKDRVQWPQEVIQAKTEQVTYEKCVATDDPRLGK